MNILLCVPHFKHKEPPHPPTGIAYVISSLRAAGFNVRVLSFFKDKGGMFEAMQKAIADHDIQAVGCGGTVWTIHEVKSVIDAAKRIKRDAITFIGGTLVTNSPVEAMAIINNADFGVIGEGEITACELMRTLERGGDPAKVESIVYRANNGGLIITDKRKELPNIDTLPYPDFDWHYSDSLPIRPFPISTSRGCTNRCTFCSVTSGTKYRLKSLDSIFAELDHFCSKYNIKLIRFIDEFFVLDKDRTDEFCRRIKTYNLQWYIQTRLSKNLTLDMLTMMKDAGCTSICYGFESADDRILTNMKKGTTVELMDSVINLTNIAKIKADGHFIFGDPEETEETVNNTRRWYWKHRHLLGRACFVPVLVRPGAKLWADAIKEGIINPIEQILKGCPPVNISKLSDEYYSNLLNLILPIELYHDVHYMLIQPASASFMEHGEGYKAVFICKECSKEHAIDIEPEELTTSFSKLHEFKCTSCGNHGSVFLFRHYVSWIEEKLEKMLKTHNCAVWPVSNHFAAAFGCSKALQNPELNYKAINSDKRLIGELLLGKTVEAPEALAQGSGIDTVIVFSQCYKEIENELRTKYPHIVPALFHEIGLKP